MADAGRAPGPPSFYLKKRDIKLPVRRGLRRFGRTLPQRQVQSSSAQRRHHGICSRPSPNSPFLPLVPPCVNLPSVSFLKPNSLFLCLVLSLQMCYSLIRCYNGPILRTPLSYSSLSSPLCVRAAHVDNLCLFSCQCVFVGLIYRPQAQNLSGYRSFFSPSPPTRTWLFQILPNGLLDQCQSLPHQQVLFYWL